MSEGFVEHEYSAEDEMLELRKDIREVERYTDPESLHETYLLIRAFLTRWDDEKFLGDPDRFLATGRFGEEIEN